jgi:putative oxidoreductase
MSLMDSAPAPAGTHWSLWALRAVLAAFFLFMAVKNLAGDDAMAADFERWGYPSAFRVVTACLQLAGGVALLWPAMVFPGAVLLAGILIGAIVTHLRHDPVAHAISPAVFLILVTIVLATHRPERWPFVR